MRVLGLHRLLAAAGLLVPLLLGGPHSDRLTTSAVVSHAQPGISLLSQTPYVVKQGSFVVQLGIQDPDPNSDFLQVLGFQNLITRTSFDQALSGQYQGVAFYSPTVAVKELPSDPKGGFDVQIPVSPYGAAAAGALLPVFPPFGGSAVYPIQIGLYDKSNHRIGQPVDTFLIYASNFESQTQLPPLAVGVVLPVTAPPDFGADNAVEPLSSAQSLRLSRLVGALDSASHVPLSLSVTPQVLDALNAGPSTDQATLAGLEKAVASGDEVFPSTYVRRTISDFEYSGLDDELNLQLQAGAATFKEYFGSSPASSPWLVDGSVDYTTLDTLNSRGVDQVVLPSADMTPLPSTLTVNTFALGTQLSLPGSPNMSVYGADTGLTADFERTSSPVLNANQLLAEMAMIQLETPGDSRGVVAMPPPGFVPSAAFVSTLEAGLSGNPLLRAVPVSKLFSPALKLFSPASSVVRQIANQQPYPPAPRSLAGQATRILQARQFTKGLASLLPPGQANIAALPLELLVAESQDVTDSQRQSVIDQISRDETSVAKQINLPGPTSITLTSARSQLPLTILSSPTLHATIRLDLSSNRLIFQTYNPPHGSCQLEGPTAESCTILLVDQNTTLRVPVESRSPGVFPLYVNMFSPDGSFSLLGAQEKDTIRSTAISNVGIVLIVVALLSLAIWWVRDLRHGRRARRLVPAPAGDELVLTADPVIDSFFADPPPPPE